MAVRIMDGRKEVAAAGIAERLVATKGTMAWWVEIQAFRNNTDYVSIGASATLSATGTERGVILGALSSKPFTIDARPGGMGMIDLYDIWINAEVNDEGVNFVYGG